MNIPRFDQNRNGSDNIGDAFQKFAYDLLLFDYPGLHFFPTRGKDGGIDLSRTKDGLRLVVECKYVGTDGVSTALNRWREVARNLRTHLAEPEEAAQHEAQYGPWYSTDPAITEYIFCVSSELGNQEQQDEVQREIAGFFAEMGSRHAHLAHLSKLSVTILDWNDLATRLRNRPFVLFRWFKLLRDYGLATLDEVPDHTTFRSYLYSDKLPYYSRCHQLDVKPSPPDADIPDEDGLLSLIEGDSLTGLILTGGGGVGKTRLTLEIGYLAQSKGWVVLRVLRRLKEDALEHLARWVTPETKVLLLIDYVETQRDFDELMNELNDLNDSLNLHVRYVANCRTSYYRSIAAISRHIDINLSPALEDPALVFWFENYLRQTVRHILESNGIEVTEQHLYVCRDIPVLAVFMSYLHGMGRKPELQTLLAEKNFARWIVRRLELTFPDSPVFPNLAQLAALFPMPAAVAHHPDLKDHQESFDRLAADGWIEKFPADDEYKTETWRAAHDVFADQILLFYFESIPHTVEKFVRELLSLARCVGCLRSALTTLQRLVDKPALKALDWSGILGSAISEDPRAWRDVRDLLVRTSLLTNQQRINILGEHEEVWQGAEEEMGFQLAVGWLTRWVLEQEDTEHDESQRSIIESWIRKTAKHVVVNNYILTSGIKFCPELVQEAALNWILTRPRVFQTHYLIVAWLNQRFSFEAIRSSVEQWAARFSDNFHLSFIVRAWLEAGGDKESLRTPIERWLVKHKALADAGFVYPAWLNAGGDTEMVRDSILVWLTKYKTHADARFVYPAWLDAGGDTEAVKDSIVVWLTEHKTRAEASFVYKAWLNAGGDTEAVKDSILVWLVKHKALADAGFVYPAWLNAGGGTEMVKDSIIAWLTEHKILAEAQFVYKPWLDAGGDTEAVKDSILVWLTEHKTRAEAQFVYKAWLDAGGGTEAVKDSIVAWLTEHKTRADARFVYESWLYAGGGTEMVRDSIVAWLTKHKTRAEAQFVYKAWLDAGGDTEAVKDSIIAWLTEHKTRAEASFVYRAWLYAGGDKELIQKSLQVWLSEHGASTEADFVFRAWLEKGGSFSLIRAQAIEWLSHNYDKKEAVFLTKSIAKQPDIPVETVKNILSWCSKFPTNEDAFWRLTQLGEHLLKEEVAEEVWTASKAVLKQRLSTGAGLSSVVRDQITFLIAFLIESTGFHAGHLRSSVDEFLLRWLRYRMSYGNDPKPNPKIERPSYVKRVSDLIDSGALSVAADREPLERFLRWVNNWQQSEGRESLRPLLARLAREYPAPGLWDIVKFEERVPPNSDGSGDGI